MLFLLKSLTIAFVNTILSGDNGIMIALVMQSLPYQIRRRAIVSAIACDVIARTAATAFAVSVLRIPLLKCAGGVLIVFVSVRLFSRVIARDEQRLRRFTSPWTAVAFVVAADLLMSIDNTVAIASIAQGQVIVLFAGLAISIPLVFFGSRFVCNGMESYPVLVYVGAGIVAMLGARMMLMDTVVARIFHPNPAWARLMECAAAATVLTAGHYLRARFRRTEHASDSY